MEVEEFKAGAEVGVEIPVIRTGGGFGAEEVNDATRKSGSGSGSGGQMTQCAWSETQSAKSDGKGARESYRRQRWSREGGGGGG